MSCARYAAALKDHAIGAPLDRAAEAHLAGCGACRARLDADCRALASLDADLAAAFAVEPSPDFGAQVRVRVAQEPAPIRFWQRPLVLAIAASVLIVVGVLGLQLGRRAAPRGDALVGKDVMLHTEQPRPATDVVEIPTRGLPRTPEPPSRGRRPADVKRVATLRPMEPAVIVPADRAAAIRRYVTAVAAGRVAIPEGALPQPEPAAPEIAPLAVDPIVIPAADSATSKTTEPGF